MPPQPLQLSEDQIEFCAQEIVRTGKDPVLSIDGEDVTITAGSVTDQSYKAINERAAALKGDSSDADGSKSKGQSERWAHDETIRDADEKDRTHQFTTANEDDLLPGGVTVPEGYQFIGHFTDRDADVRAFSDLLGNVKVDCAEGLSASMEGHVGRANDNNDAHRFGTLRCRVIFDHAVRAYIFRKDDSETDTTEFIVNLGHGGPPATAL